MKGYSSVVRRRLANDPIRRGVVQVLVVDDYVDNAESMAMLLRMHGHQVETAQSGPAAVHAARARPPRVVFLDISMPDMNGYEVARELREMFGEGVLLIAVSACEADDRQQLAAASFDLYFTKPADPDQLERLVVEFGASSQSCMVDEKGASHSRLDADD